MKRRKFLKKFGFVFMAPAIVNAEQLMKMWGSEENNLFSIENNTTRSYWKKSNDINGNWQHIAVVKNLDEETYYLNGVEDIRARELFLTDMENYGSLLQFK